MAFKPFEVLFKLFDANNNKCKFVWECLYKTVIKFGLTNRLSNFSITNKINEVVLLRRLLSPFRLHQQIPTQQL